MTILAGIDLSSKAIHAALIPSDPEDTSVPRIVFRSVTLPSFDSKRLYPGGTTAQFRSTQRCRAVREAVQTLLRGPWRGPESLSRMDDVTSAWVEEPKAGGPNRSKSDNPLREIYGAILASIPPHIERAAIQPREWRAVLAAADPERISNPMRWQKQDSIALADSWLGAHNADRLVSEHEAEALLIALAGRELEAREHERRSTAA